jgi:hypothetical protein
MIKIEFPADRKDIALAFAEALLRMAGREQLIPLQAAGSTKPSKPAPEPELPPATLDDLKGAGSLDADEGDDGDDTGGAKTSKPEIGKMPDHDVKGVAFDEKMCAQAREPFYASGKKAGQWKCRKGVAEDKYDVWYAGQLASAARKTPAGTAPATEPQVDPREAFGGATATPTTPVINTMGELMRWISEKQAAGHMTQDHVNAAYRNTNRTMTDLFSPDAKHVESTVHAIHADLVKMVGV